MTHEWSKHGPESYFSSIEKKYGRSISHWQAWVTNALVGWTLAGNAALDGE